MSESGDSTTSKATVEALMGEYLTDPFNCINLQVASAVNLGVPLVGELNVVNILAGYLGSVIASLIHSGEDREYVIDTISSIHAELLAAVESGEESAADVAADGDTTTPIGKKDVLN